MKHTPSPLLGERHRGTYTTMSNETEQTITPSAYCALAVVQTKLRANKNKRNDFGGYSYRNKEGVLEAVKPLLHEVGATLTISDEPVLIGTRFYIRATATFRVGDDSISSVGYARECETKKGMDEAQITGAASSYAGKYALCNLLAIDDSSVDPDANNDHGKRLPDLLEIELITRCKTVDELRNAYKVLSKKDIAVGYLKDLCEQHKANLTQE